MLADKIVNPEKGVFVDCYCDFTTIHNLPPGQYVITLDEPLVPLEEKKFIIDIDLEDVPMDQICQFRDFYPWRDQ